MALAAFGGEWQAIVPVDQKTGERLCCAAKDAEIARLRLALETARNIMEDTCR